MTITHVQGNIVSFSSSGAALALSFVSGTVGAGNSVVGGVTYDISNGSILLSVTDDKSNSYTIVNTLSDAVNGQAVSIYCGINLRNGPSRVIANFTSSQPASSAAIAINEYTSLSAAKTNSYLINNSSSTTVSSGSMAVVQASLIYATLWNVVFPITAGTGFTLRNSSASLYDEDMVQLTSGTVAATFITSTSNSNRDVNGVVVSQLIAGSFPSVFMQTVVI